MLKKLLCLFLCFIFVCATLALTSCDNAVEGGTDSSSSAVIGENANSGSTEDEEDYEFIEAKNWGGVEVNILTYDHDYEFSTCQVVAEELTNEPINDAFYERNALIEDKYGITIVAHYPEGDEDYIAMIQEDIISDSRLYDAVVGQIVYVAALATNGRFLDFNSINNGILQLDKPWWDQNLQRDIALNGKNFFITGDALVEDDQATWAIYFNKDLVQSHNLSDPYALVKEGHFRYVRIGATIRVSKQSFDEWLDRQEF
jgi:ABC-type glycerol-3-phosphate transport system substrate-binding protein